MDRRRLREAEEAFLKQFPGGFSHPEMLQLAKKHKVEKMKKLAQESFAAGNFELPDGIVDSMGKIVSQSSLISIFEKPKFRDFIKGLSEGEKVHFSHGLREFFYGDQALGFGLMTGLLQEYKLAKWPLVTVFGIYLRPDVEVFIKPTTVKGIIDCFDLGLTYRPTPSFAFYQEFRENIMELKHSVHPSLQVDNAAFCGFLMMAIDGYHTKAPSPRHV